jgi:hypothetical protein
MPQKYNCRNGIFKNPKHYFLQAKRNIAIIEGKIFLPSIAFSTTGI